jgi:RNA polymerase sigma factor (sigma-70 family)
VPPTPPLHDLDLQRRAKTDRAAMDELVRGCGAFIEAIRQKALTDAQVERLGWTREDAWQEAAMAFVEAARACDPERGALGTVATVAIRNRMWMELRRRRYRPDDSASLDAPADPSIPDLPPLTEAIAAPPDPAMDADALALHLAIARLPPKRRFVVQAWLAGLDQAQTAAAMGFSRSYVSCIWLRALTDLRRALDEDAPRRRSRRRAAAS